MQRVEQILNGQEFFKISIMKKLLILFVLSTTQIVTTAQSYNWVTTFSTATKPPASVVMAVDDAENTYVLAMYQCQGSGCNYGSVLAKYTPAGVLLWKKDIHQLANAKMVVDHNSHVLVAGSDGGDYSVIRYGPGGAELKKSKLLP